MTPLIKPVGFVVCLLLVVTFTGCSTLQPGDFANSPTRFQLDHYFDGHSRSWGVFENTSGEPRRYFTCDNRGKRNKDGGVTLTQHFQFNDGKKQLRVWHIRRTDSTHWEATANDMVGVAKGEGIGNAFYWQYTITLDRKNPLATVHVSQWMYQPEGTTDLMTRLIISKLGVSVSEVSEVRMSIGMTICLMLKVPRPGEVKTRLGHELGMVDACAIYRKLVEHQLAQIPSWCQLEVHYTPADQKEEMKGWLGNGLKYVVQSNGSLGQRMQHAAESAFAKKAESVLFLGGDCPDVTLNVLEQTAEHLESRDVVLGPALDGGYYLIAMKKCHPRLFDQIAWSTDKVMAQTKDRIHELGLSSFLLPIHSDIDDLASLRLAQKAHAFLR